MKTGLENQDCFSGRPGCRPEISSSPSTQQQLLLSRSSGCFSPEVMELRARAGDEQELSRRQLGDGDLGKNSPSRCQHVADVSLANLGQTVHRGNRLFDRQWNHQLGDFLRQATLVLYLRHGVGKQAVEQLERVFPCHDELPERREVDHAHLLHHQSALSPDRSEPVGTSETGPEGAQNVSSCVSPQS